MIFAVMRKGRKMTEYKDVTAIKTGIQKICDNCSYPHRLGGCPEHCGINDAIKIIDSSPTIDPERKKGKPIFKHGESLVHVSYANGTGGFESHKWADWVCPECGWFVGEQYVPRRHNQSKSNFCSRCGCEIDWTGADMRGDRDADD